MCVDAVVTQSTLHRQHRYITDDMIGASGELNVLAATENRRATAPIGLGYNSPRGDVEMLDDGKPSAACARDAYDIMRIKLYVREVMRWDALDMSSTLHRAYYTPQFVLTSEVQAYSSILCPQGRAFLSLLARWEMNDLD